MRREGALVWATADYQKTGVVPYVHDDGARVPSLRRLYKKHPYLTNGSAPDLDSLLERVRFSTDSFWHQTSPIDGETARATGTLDARTRADLIAFLDLL